MANYKTPTLSKSRFLAGEQCQLRLWYQCYNPHLAAEISPAQQAIFDTGHEVGRLATKLYPGGVLIEEDHLHHDQAVRSTLQAMANPDVKAIYEAAFFYDDTRVRVDILQRLDKGRWNLIEVKSSTSVKPEHLPDVAIQSYVLCGARIDIYRVQLLHINNQYVYDGDDLDLESLFTSSDVTEEAIALQNEIPGKISELNAMLTELSPPAIQPSRHCNKPYRCAFWEHCTRDTPEHWVMELPGISQKKLDELTALGVNAIEEIPVSFPLSAIQKRIRNCIVNSAFFVSAELEAELKSVEYPVHFIDFETVSPAIPRYAGTRPYQTTPFQWSDHILHGNGTTEHQEYLSDGGKDPREEFIRTLLDAVGKSGTIFIYTNYEKTIVTKLGEDFPELQNKLTALSSRFIDLHALIRNYYYHPDFHGSFSLKSVLPALVPEMNYESLAIQDGNHASSEYLRMINPATPAQEQKKIQKDLLTYCGHDTLAMVKMREKLIN